MRDGAKKPRVGVLNRPSVRNRKWLHGSAFAALAGADEVLFERRRGASERSASAAAAAATTSSPRRTGPVCRMWCLHAPAPLSPPSSRRRGTLPAADFIRTQLLRTAAACRTTTKKKKARGGGFSRDGQATVIPDPDLRATRACTASSPPAA